MYFAFILKLAPIVPIVITCSLLVGCRSAQTHASSGEGDLGPAADVRISLDKYGLPAGFFQPGFDTKCASQIIGYRFVVWLDYQHVAVGFNTSPNCRQSSDREVAGSLRVLVFDINGNLKASRTIPYLADGNGEIVTGGEGIPGPNGTLLIRIESVNLDKEGQHESKSGVLLLDANLKDVAQLDGFLEQTTLVDHALVFQKGLALTGPRTYSILDGAGPKEIAQRQVDWPTGAMDRKFGEHGFAFMLCGQQLRHGEYTSTNVVHEGAKFRCSLNAQGEDGKVWAIPLEDGETAALVGLLGDGSVVGQVQVKGSNGGRLVIWRKDGHPEALPWLTPQFEGNVDTATRGFSRYASFATNDGRPCNPIAKLLGTACDEGGKGRWLVFDRSSHTPVVNRTFPKNGRAALSPDGFHYASFESSELRIYSLPASHR
jgi:hypothetical protein